LNRAAAAPVLSTVSPSLVIVDCTSKAPVMVSPVILTKPVAVSRAFLSSLKTIFLVSVADVSTIAIASSSATLAPVRAVNSEIF